MRPHLIALLFGAAVLLASCSSEAYTQLPFLRFSIYRIGITMLLGNYG